MRNYLTYPIENPKLFVEKLLFLTTDKFTTICCLNSNKNLTFSSSNYTEDFCFLIAVGNIKELIVNDKTGFESLKKFYDIDKDWLFGFFSYDVKNEIENLTSEHIDNIGMPLLHFFQPEYVIKVRDKNVEIRYVKGHSKEKEVQDFYNEIIHSKYQTPNLKSQINNRISKEQYLKAVNQLKKHIQLGDIYEVNFCQEWYAENVSIHPLSIYFQMNELSPMPFSCFYRLKDKYLLCASPERFIKKKGQKIISQPIKGTIRRGNTAKEDDLLKQQLLSSQKEKSENVMIVDLVRNDLSRTAKKASVKVEELFGIYTFKQVHQMISTISSELREDVHFLDAIKFAFPMGSMTGAPKIRAMELIEKYESAKRGLFSGSVGYITPDADFDFNVVIRSILYNETNKYLSFMAGGAITTKSIPEQEYEECLLKAKPLFELFSPKNSILQ